MSPSNLKEGASPNVWNRASQRYVTVKCGIHHAEVNQGALENLTSTTKNENLGFYP